MSAEFPTQTQIVIIGGGIAGCSTAYHLTRLGLRDVLVLERKTIASGTAWASAGLLAPLCAKGAMTKLARYGMELYAGLEAEVGHPTGYTRTGSIWVSRTAQRRREFSRSLVMARTYGIDMREIGLDEARRLFPLMNIDDLTGAWYQPDDGHINPEDVTQALARGASSGGATLLENIKVTGIQVKNNAICGLHTDHGDIACEIVVNCAGIWSREVGKMVGVSIPIHAVERTHVATSPVQGAYDGMPYILDMDGSVQIRGQNGGLLIGGFDPVSQPWGVDAIPDDYTYTQIKEDWDKFEFLKSNAIQRVPILETTEIKSVTTVPESFSPDTAYMLGEAPGVKNFFVAAGMNSISVTSVGGAGMALAQWIDQGYPEEDLWPIDLMHYHGWQNNHHYLQDRMSESVGNLYADHWPYKQPRTSRNARCTPFYDRQAAQGAYFGVGADWERPYWFAPPGVKAEVKHSWGRQNWFEYSAAEHMAIRENVGVYDLSSMSEYMVEGRDALATLQYLCCNNIDVPVGKVVYTQMLNERGGTEADITVTRLAENQFFIVDGAIMYTRNLDYLKRHIAPDTHCVVTDVTSAYMMLAVMGPNARDLLTTMTDADLSNEAFSFGTAQWLDAAYAKPLLMRISYVGELGWELYIPTEFSNNVYDALMEAGKAFDLKLVGMHAVDSLRLEKGYKHWAIEMTPDDTPLETGLGFCVNFQKGNFVGREALLAQKETGIKRQLVTFILQNPEPLIYQGEPVYRNGELVCEITHGAYAHMFSGAIGSGYLENPDGITDEWVLSGTYEIEVEGQRYSAQPYLQPPHDPQNTRVRM